MLGVEYNLSYNQWHASCEFADGHIESKHGWTRNCPLGRTICYHNIEYNVGPNKPSQHLWNHKWMHVSSKQTSEGIALIPSKKA